jgi:hypothetical protein
VQKKTISACCPSCEDRDRFVVNLNPRPDQRQDTIIQIRGDPQLSHRLSHHVVAAQHQTKAESEAAIGHHVGAGQQEAAAATAILSGFGQSATKANCAVEIFQRDSLGIHFNKIQSTLRHQIFLFQ